MVTNRFTILARLVLSRFAVLFLGVGSGFGNFFGLDLGKAGGFGGGFLGVDGGLGGLFALEFFGGLERRRIDVSICLSSWALSFEH